MNISTLPSLPELTYGSSTTPTGSTSHGETVRSLAKALSSGDLQGASQAYAAIQQRAERVAQAANSQESASTSSRAEAFQQLGQALQNRNLDAAQQAFSQWRQGSSQNTATHSTSGHSGATHVSNSNSSSTLSADKEKLLEPPPAKRHFFPRMVSPGVGGTIDIKV